MKLLIMQLSSTSSQLIPLRSNYFPPYALVKHPQPLLLP
jgi:hypothetical protein